MIVPLVFPMTVSWSRTIVTGLKALETNFYGSDVTYTPRRSEVPYRGSENGSEELQLMHYNDIMGKSIAGDPDYCINIGGYSRRCISR